MSVEECPGTVIAVGIEVAGLITLAIPVKGLTQLVSSPGPGFDAPHETAKLTANRNTNKMRHT